MTTQPTAEQVAKSLCKVHCLTPPCENCAAIATAIRDYHAAHTPPIDSDALLAWWNAPSRKPSHLAFTAGPMRVVADLMEHAAHTPEIDDAELAELKEWTEIGEGVCGWDESALLKFAAAMPSLLQAAAENKRLREALEIIGTANTQPISADYMSPDCMKTLAREALKGGR